MMKFSCLTPSSLPRSRCLDVTQRSPKALRDIQTTAARETIHLALVQIFLKLEAKKLHLRKSLRSFYGAKLTFAALYKVYKDVNVGLLSLDLNVRDVKAK